jgi:subtilase family serine protease
LRILKSGPVVAALVLLTLSGLATTAAAAPPATRPGRSHKVCDGTPAPGFARCHAHVVETAAKGSGTITNPTPTGLAPAAIKSAYGFPTDLTAGAGKTVAIVDAFDSPTAENDLNVFSRQYGLPACTTANGCFKKADQRGGKRYPRKDPGWALEISLDVQWAHAIAPGAKILLVEADSNSFGNLLAAVDYAKNNAQYVSNSWGASEFSGEASYDSHFAKPGVSMFVSAGDNGLPAEYPSASPNVVSVGGTLLTFAADGSLASESAWTSGGGGCSLYESATPAQAAFAEYANTGCDGKRSTPDVSLDADPASGVSVYDSTTYNNRSGWFTVGGTSASAPMWAGRAAVAGTVVDAAGVYARSATTFRDITVGNNGAPCLTGFDLCAGRGSWIG